MGIIQKIVDLITQVISWVLDLVKRILARLIERFKEVNSIEKIIIICFVPAFFAVVTPVCKYRIFGGDKYINNPIAEHLIGIVFAYFFMLYFKGRFAFLQGKIIFIIAEVLNGLYLVRLIYQHLGPGIIKTPYIVTYGYYVNIIIAIVFGLLSLADYLVYNDE